MVSNSSPNFVASLLIINQKCYLMQHQSSTARFSSSPTADINQVMLASATARLEAIGWKCNGNDVLANERLNGLNDGDVEVEQSSIEARMIPIILSNENCSELSICVAAAEVNEVRGSAKVETEVRDF